MTTISAREWLPRCTRFGAFVVFGILTVITPLAIAGALIERALGGALVWLSVYVLATYREFWRPVREITVTDEGELQWRTLFRHGAIRAADVTTIRVRHSTGRTVIWHRAGKLVVLMPLKGLPAVVERIEALNPTATVRLSPLARLLWRRR